MDSTVGGATSPGAGQRFGANPRGRDEGTMGNRSSGLGGALPNAMVVDAPASAPVVPLLPAKVHCTVCVLRGLCMPAGLDRDAVERLDAAIHLRLRVKRKDTLYRPGDRFTALYAIRLGTFKTVALAEDGLEQIT